MDYQKLTLIGNATGDWGRYLSKRNNSAYTAFRLVVKDKRERPTAFHILAFGELAEKVARSLKKGSRVYVEGSLIFGQQGRLHVLADYLQLDIG
jgi:single-stranded DNA-binding protein